MFEHRDNRTVEAGKGFVGVLRLSNFLCVTEKKKGKA